MREGPLRSQARGEGTPAVARRREGAGEQREAGKQVSGVSWVLSVGTGGSSVLMARCHSSCPFPWTAEGSTASNGAAALGFGALQTESVFRSEEHHV